MLNNIGLINSVNIDFKQNHNTVDKVNIIPSKNNIVKQDILPFKNTGGPNDSFQDMRHTLYQHNGKSNLPILAKSALSQKNNINENLVKSQSNLNDEDTDSVDTYALLQNKYDSFNKLAYKEQ